MIEMWAALEAWRPDLHGQCVGRGHRVAAALFDEFLSSAPAEHIDEYSDANIAFHQAIIRLSGSHLMGKTIENLFIHVRAIRRLTISQSDRAARSIIDHMQIIESLERRDTELADGWCANTRLISPHTSTNMRLSGLTRSRRHRFRAALPTR